MYVVQKRRVDYDGWPLGDPFGRVGPFATAEDAERWIESEYPHNLQTGRRGDLSANVILQVVNLLDQLTSPHDYKKGK